MLCPCNTSVNVVFNILNAVLQCLSDVFTLYPVPTPSHISFPYNSCCTGKAETTHLDPHLHGLCFIEQL